MFRKSHHPFSWVGNPNYDNSIYNYGVLYPKKRNTVSPIVVMISLRDDAQLLFIEHKLKEQIKLLELVKVS